VVRLKSRTFAWQKKRGRFFFLFLQKIKTNPLFGFLKTTNLLFTRYKSSKLAYEADLGAEKLLAAEKGMDRIVVEVKSFLKLSFANEFHGILGQYITYLDALEYLSLDRELIIAIPKFAEDRLKDYPFIRHLIEKHNLKMFVFDEKEEIILEWKR
jgi:hypothetical protein